MKTQSRKLLTDQMRRRLVSARKARPHVTQKLMAETLGITPVYMTALENGRAQPHFSTLDVWCTVLGLELRVEIK